MNFPTTAEEFYKRRDSRTSECTSSCLYQQTQCVVRVPAEKCEDLQTQVMLIGSCNLLSQWCRNVTIELPKTVRSRLGFEGDLAHAVIDQMKNTDPFGTFEVKDHVTRSGDIELLINEASAGKADVVSIFSCDWTAQIGGNELTDPVEPSNVVGALAAACLGGSELFKRAILGKSAGNSQPYRFNAFGDPGNEVDSHYPADLDIGNVLMVGAGSVASGCAYCLDLLRVRCNLAVVDHDIVKVENFNRSPIFGRNNHGLPKVDALSTFLTRSEISVQPFAVDWQEFINRRLANLRDFDLWLPLANERNVRWSMQNNYPPLMIHASTSKNWAVNFGRHIPGKDDCILDRFPTRTASTTCAETLIETATGMTDAALPFLSFFAGLIVAIDIIQLKISGYPFTPNHRVFYFGDDFQRQGWNRIPEESCLCKTQQGVLWNRLNGGRRYASHSPYSLCHYPNQK